MMTRILLVVGVFAAATIRLTAVAVGDSYEKVVQEKGKPSGVMKTGDTQILRYADQTIKLKGGAVVSIAAFGPAVAAATTPVRSTELNKQPVGKPPVPEREETADAGQWMTDYNAALEEAKTSDRHTFLFFTGSDWCGWCKRLVREILATPEFKQYARENLVLVELDFPRGKPQPEALKAQNAQLARRYKIEGYPTVVVLNSEGKVVGELGYQPDGPGPFIERLRGM